jgi:hypothetical protein
MRDLAVELQAERTFVFSITSTTSEPAVIEFGEAISAILEDLPSWIDGSWSMSLVTGVQRAPRSKVRAAFLDRPTRLALDRVVRTDRAGRLCGLSLVAAPPHHESGIDDSTTVSIDWHPPAVRAELRCVPSDELLASPSFGRSVIEVADRLVVASGEVAHGVGCWGGLVIDPFLSYARGVDLNDRTMLWGYSWVTVLVPEVIERLGGPTGLLNAPVESVRYVQSGGGQQCAIASLTEAPASVTAEHLRAWKRFLAPVLWLDAPERRRDALAQLPAQRPAWYTVPRMILPEDWPSLSDVDRASTGKPSA